MKQDSDAFSSRYPIPVVRLLGLARIPKDRSSATKWFERNGIAIQVKTDDGRKPEFTHISNLPEVEGVAYRLRLAEEAGLAFGEQNDAAHVELQGKPMGMQEMAHARAAILAFVHRHQEAGLTWPQIAAQFKGAGFGDGPSYKTVKRWFEMVLNVDPANWVPALAPD